MGATHRLLPDGRLHLQHGPIDMIVAAEGPADAVAEARRRAIGRFAGLLEELVAELPVLRQPVRAGGDCPLTGPVARRMWSTARAHLPTFVTPMAAVAGAGAEAMLAVMSGVPGIIRAYANNGGDIALYLTPDAQPWRLGLIIDPAAPASPGMLVIGPDDPWRGIATSGAKGRSHSLGIADSVTVLAANAPAADVAATLLANAVDLPGDPAITRVPACDLWPDSDLGDRLVTTRVGPLDAQRVARALDRGEALARELLLRHRIGGAILTLRGVVRLVGQVQLEENKNKGLIDA